MQSTPSEQLATWLARPMSYSQFSSWEFDPDQWYSKYILDKAEPSNPAMTFGNTVGDTLGTPMSMVPQLTVVPGIKEYEMRAHLGNIELVGYADHYCPIEYILNENKTSQSATRWTQETVDEHTQLHMYALLLFLQDKVKPEDVRMQLNYIPVKMSGLTVRLCTPIEVFSFPTKRTTLQVTKYAQYIQETRRAMEVYAQKRLAQA